LQPLQKELLLNTMKAFISAIAALAATASADAQIYGLGLPYGGYGYGGLGYGLAAPTVVAPAPVKLCKDPIWGAPVLCAPEEEAAPAEEEAAKEKRSADAQFWGLGYGYGGLGYGVAPVIEGKETGLIFTKGAVTPDFTAEQKEANPEIAGDSEAIKVPVVTGVQHFYGKREAEPYYGLGYGGYYGGYGLGAPLIAPVELKCKDPWGLPALCPPEPEAEEAKEKRSADAQLYGLPYGGYGYGGLYGAPLIAPIALNCKNAWGFPVPCAQETPAEEEAAAKEKRSADAQLYGLPYGGYGYGGLYGAPLIGSVDCKNLPDTGVWSFPGLCAEETPAEEEAAAKEKRSADAQLYLGGLYGWGLPGPLIHSSHFGICTNVDGEQVDC